jgi:hypothetical protein
VSRGACGGLGTLANGVACRWPEDDDLAVKMHADQVDIDADAVFALVADRFPRWRGLPMRTVPHPGAVNPVMAAIARHTVRAVLE